MPRPIHPVIHVLSRALVPSDGPEPVALAPLGERLLNEALRSTKDAADLSEAILQLSAAASVLYQEQRSPVLATQLARLLAAAGSLLDAPVETPLPAGKRSSVMLAARASRSAPKKRARER